MQVNFKNALVTSRRDYGPNGDREPNSLVKVSVDHPAYDGDFDFPFYVPTSQLGDLARGDTVDIDMSAYAYQGKNGLTVSAHVFKASPVKAKAS